MNNKKFIESKNIDNYQILTDTGWSDIIKSHKTIPYKVYYLKLSDGKEFKCADNHIVFDRKFKNIFVKDLKVDDEILVESRDNELVAEAVSDLLVLDYEENMFDLELSDKSNHRYYTNGILSHNTSTARALFEQYLMPYDYINASNETSVDVVRERIEKWCSTFSIIEGGATMKGVILDELDGVSDQFSKALKATMEKFEKNSRFIATTNHINKIPDAVRSRFEEISFDFTDEEESEVFKGYCKRVYEICKLEGITISKEALVELVKRKFPDMRNILRVLQGYANEGITEITIDTVKKFHGVHKDVFELIFNNIDPIKNYQHLVSEYSSKVDDVLATLGTDFIDYIAMEKPNYTKNIPQIIVTVAKYQQQRTQVIDEVISLLACVFECQNIIINTK